MMRMVETTLAHDIRVGDVFYTSWGYDQTNEYIVVVELLKSGKTAVCQRAEFVSRGASGQNNLQEPIPKGYGDKFRMKIVVGFGNATWALRGSAPYSNGKLYDVWTDGTKHKQTLGVHTYSRAKPGRVFAETDSQFGH
jgi:hypothetical protein